jgi:catechol 2,3-dioxygenase-like lactoylglutathione lyase family enzyme
MDIKSDWDFDHVGLVVRDLDEVLTYYRSLGVGVNIGPLGPNTVRPVPTSPEEEPAPTTMTIYGKPPADRPRPVIANLQVGSLVVECIHGPAEPHSMSGDFLRDHGDGISHICYNVPDPEKETSELVQKGSQSVMSLEARGKIVENYLDTGKYGNIWLSFRPMPEKWHRAWQAHNRAHPLVSSWKFMGMGVATKDLDKAVKYYQSLGIATLQPGVILDSISSRDFKVHGLTGSAAKARIRTLLVGSVTYEFAQSLERETTYGSA